MAPVACAYTAHGLGSSHRWAGIFSAFKPFNCDMKIVTPCYIAKAMPFLRVPSGIVETE